MITHRLWDPIKIKDFVVDMIFIIIIIAINTSNSNWTEWSTIQGVIASNSELVVHEAQGQFEIMILVNPIIVWCKVLLNNYWMRLSLISWIIKTEVCVICRSQRLKQITQKRGFDNSWYHAKTEFNNYCFIIHFSHNSSSETEAKRSASLFLRTLQGS